MRYVSILVLLLNCAGIPPNRPNANNCGLVMAGDFDGNGEGTLTKAILDDRLDAALSSIVFVTDPEIFDIMEQCQKLVGYRIYTKPTRGFTIPNKPYLISGATWCWNKTIVVGTPDNNDWTKSSIVHEIYHVWQNCNSGDGPPDRLNDTDHANWERYGIYEAIEIARNLP